MLSVIIWSMPASILPADPVEALEQIASVFALSAMKQQLLAVAAKHGINVKRIQASKDSIGLHRPDLRISPRWRCGVVLIG